MANRRPAFRHPAAVGPRGRSLDSSSACLKGQVSCHDGLSAARIYISDTAAMSPVDL
jgi:hypothetical protein